MWLHPLPQLTGDVQVHAGFLNQFESLAISPSSDQADLLKALRSLAGGIVPRRVTCSGFSLGGALSELCGVWAAILWPGADILVANQVGACYGGLGLTRCTVVLESSCKSRVGSGAAWGAPTWPTLRKRPPLGCRRWVPEAPHLADGTTALSLQSMQGGPIPGNSEFRTLFEAAVGRAYKCGLAGVGWGLLPLERLACRPAAVVQLGCIKVFVCQPAGLPFCRYVYRMDIVPSAAPLSWYKRVPASIWYGRGMHGICSATVCAQVCLHGDLHIPRCTCCRCVA